MISTAEGSAANRQAPAMARDLKARRWMREAVIAIGAAGRTRDWALRAEFGALCYRGFQPWRDNQFESWDGGPGYAVHPAIAERRRGRGRAVRGGVDGYRRGRVFPD